MSKWKQRLKSKTMRFGIVTIIVAILSMFGVGDVPDEDATYREISEGQSSRVEQIMNILILVGGGGAIYGREVAKGKIGGKDE